MAIGIGAMSAVVEAAYNAAMVITLPTHSVGDLLVFHQHGGANTFVAGEDTTLTTGTTGWTQGFSLVDAALGRDKGGCVWYKIAGASEADPSFDPHATGTGTVYAGWVQVLTGVDGTPLDSAGVVVASQNDPNAACPAIVTANDNAIVIIHNGHGHDRTGDAGAPTNYTLLYSHESADRNLMTAYKIVATAATETPGAWTGTVNASADCIKGTISFKAAAAGTGITAVRMAGSPGRMAGIGGGLAG